MAVLVLAALVPAGAIADGDPASDVLLGENVFYPYSPPVSAPLQKSLNATTAAAKRAGFPIKVALIASPVDLGVIPDLFGKPQKYAEFLDQEISFRGKQPLLVVMPAGYGVQGLSPSATSAAASLAEARLRAGQRACHRGGERGDEACASVGPSDLEGVRHRRLIVVERQRRVEQHRRDHPRRAGGDRGERPGRDHAPAPANGRGAAAEGG